MSSNSFILGISDEAVAVLVSNLGTLNDSLFARLEEKYDLFVSSPPVGEALIITGAMVPSLSSTSAEV